VISFFFEPPWHLIERVIERAIAYVPLTRPPSRV